MRENSIVLIRNIGNEPKRETLKFARVEKIHGSRDNAQRVVTLTYNNIRMNKNGDWVGTPVTVDRSVNDLVLVDNALSDSMLGSRMTTKKDELHEKEKVTNDDEISENNIANDDKVLETTEPANSDDKNDDSNNANENNDDIKEAEMEGDSEPTIAIVGDDNIEKESGTEVRKSTRKRVQRMVIEADDIGDCDTRNDPDYRN